MARPREFDEPEVIEAALEVFWKQGYCATSVQDLVEATGLQRGSLYGAFGDKRSLYLLALEQYATSNREAMHRKIDAAADPVAVVRAMLASVASASIGSCKERGCFMGNTAVELAPHDDEVRARLHEIFGALQGVIEYALRLGQERGTWPAERSARGVAALLVCAMQGIAVRGKVGIDKRTARAMRDEILTLLGA